MKTILLIIGAVAVLLVVTGIGFVVWMHSLAKDDGPVNRPTYGNYTWTQGKPPRGGPVPREDGYVVGSLGRAFILPPMPPERPMDIHRWSTVAHNDSMKSCFWPGPKLRAGFYTTDPDDYGIENQLPDTMNTFTTAWFKIPANARIVLKGEFPHMRHWSFSTYREDGLPMDAIDDDQIDPDKGSFNPFRPGVPRNATPRRYTIFIANGDPPAQKPNNTIYTMAPPDTAIGMHMRNYVPDLSIDYLGGVAVPEIELVFDDGRVLKGEDACAVTKAPLRGKQVPLPGDPRMWQVATRLFGKDPATAPAKSFEAEPMEMFFNRDYTTLKTYFNPLAFDFLAKQKGGFWSNLSTRYGYKYINQKFGKVYVVRGKMPRVPKTWSGSSGPLDQNADMRYWSICTTASPQTGLTVDCLFDEAVLPAIDNQGQFTVVISRAPDRPSNANDKCGVAWMEWGNGDGIPGGSRDFGLIINRHTRVNPNFKQSWFAVTRPNSEREALGDYLPYVLNLHDKQSFEALGCPVDTNKLAAMVLK